MADKYDSADERIGISAFGFIAVSQGSASDTTEEGVAYLAEKCPCADYV
jgi:hypothetical protein